MSEMNENKHHALWGGRFEGGVDAFTQRFGASLPFDKRMWREDIEGSVAHAHMLGAQGILSDEDVEAICAGLDRVAESIEAGTFDFDINDEDIHMSIERNLTEDIGAAGGRLHTGRSRNDQVATDMHLIAKRLSSELADKTLELRAALLARAEENEGVTMPGYTHMQKAQPVQFSHHLLAYYWMFARDTQRFDQACESADILPLGSAALAGTTYPLDRFAVAEELGFADVYPNSMDAVSDRDYLLDLLSACSICAMHLSRLSEELVYWSSEEFGFIRMSDAYSTGSSIMPQKKNPDFAELIRGKTGRVYGDLMGLLVTLKGLPLTYDKDMQEDREGFFDAVDTVMDCLHCMSGMISTMTVNAERMKRGAEGGFMAATDLADYLVGKGLPFREAHEVVGSLVLFCEKQGRTLQSLTPAELHAFNELFDEGAAKAVDIDEIVSKRNTFGGTGHDAVHVQLVLAKERLEEDGGQL